MKYETWVLAQITSKINIAICKDNDNPITVLLEKTISKNVLSCCLLYKAKYSAAY